MSYVSCKINSRERLSRKFSEGLQVAEKFFEDEISREEAMIELFDLMRAFEEFDYHNGSKVMKRFTSDKNLIRAIYHDMSISDHGTNEFQKNLQIDKRCDLKFKTTMKFKGALRLFIALARNVLGKDSVKKIMESTSISFKKFGREKKLQKYLDKHLGEIILKNFAE